MVAIKDFGMPKQCASCFARAMVDGKISTYEICTLTESVLSTEDLCDRRNPNCPLVEIDENTSHNNVEIIDVKKLNSLFPKNKREEKTEWTS